VRLVKIGLLPRAASPRASDGGRSIPESIAHAASGFPGT
jgi:hypothetical protein